MTIADELTVSTLTTFAGDFDPDDPDSPEGASEVVAYDGGLVYVTNGNLDRIDIFGLSSPDLVASIPLDIPEIEGFDGVQSVAAANGLVAVAISREDTELDDGTVVGTPGVVAFFNAETLELIELIEVGVLPDQLSFSADGRTLTVANEGEFNADSDTDADPAGSISIIDIRPRDNGGFRFRDETIDFSTFDRLGEMAEAKGIRIAPGSDIALNLEPEYTAISPDGSTLYVTLQENNAVAIVDLRTKTLTDIVSLGVVDHSVVGIDPADDGVVDIRTFDNLVGMRMPDAITAFEIDGQNYFMTANEGDGRGDYFIEDEINGEDVIVGIDTLGDEASVGDILEVNGAFGAVTFDQALIDSGALEGLEDLTISVIDGDTDGDGDIDVVHAFGSRSFTIFDTAGNVVFDSGSEFSDFIGANFPGRFQDDDSTFNEDRADDKGVEPEAIEVGEINGQTYAFIGLERDSGIMIYNITDPSNAYMVEYIDGVAAGNISPEILTFVPASESTTGTNVLLASYEVSGTTVAYELDSLLEPVDRDRPRSDPGDGRDGPRDPNPSDGRGDGDIVIDGSNRSDELVGGVGDDALNGRRGRDLLDGRLGNDELTGGRGPDTFVFEGAFGDDVITDFNGRTDTIQIVGASDATVSISDLGAVITVDGGGSIMLLGVDEVALDQLIFA